MNQKYNYKGELFLDALYKELHKDSKVTKYKETKKEAIRRYLERLEEIHQRANTETKQALIKEMYFRKYLPTEEQLDSIILPEGIEKQDILEAQKKSLSEWLDYLMNEDEVHPVWLKYLVFQSILRMGTKNPDTGMYNKRSKQTTTPFPEFNQEILTKSMDIINQYVMKDNISDDVLSYYTKKDKNFVSYIRSGNFSKIYAILENEYIENFHKRQLTTEGKWVLYHQGSKEDANQLVKDLYHKSTGWCTAGESFATSQICGPYSNAPKGGDFYVYYSKDEEGEYSVPRIAIRLINDDKVGEIRGVNRKQHLESSMIPILEEKIHTLNLEENSKIMQLKKIENLKELIRIDKKRKEAELTTEELAFIYTTSFGFGWNNDPRVDRILESRNILEDYERMTNNHDKALMISMHRNKFPDTFKIQNENLATDIIEYNYTCIPVLDPQLENYNELLRKAIERNPFALNYINPKDTNIYYDLCKLALTKNHMVFEIIDSTSLEEEQYIDLVNQVLTENPSMIRHIDSNRINKNSYQEIIQTFGFNYPKEILSSANFDSFTEEEYEKIILPILERNNYQGIEYIKGEKLGKEKYLDLYFQALQKDSTVLSDIDTNFLTKEEYKEFCLKAIHSSIPIISNIKFQYSNDSNMYKEIVMEAIQSGNETLLNISKVLLKSTKIGLLDANDYQEIKKILISHYPSLSIKSKEELEKLDLKEIIREEEAKTI